MNLNNLKPLQGSQKAKKRIGRGQGSGRGGTSTKGHKGQQARSGYNFRPWFEGGQMPLYRRIPKFGFKNPFRVEYDVINLDTLQYLAEQNAGLQTVDHAYLAQVGIIAKPDQLVKVLGRGELKAKLSVKVNKFSNSAKAAIEAAGGEATEV
jgi:large subunit ribosomal protein L15